MWGCWQLAIEAGKRDSPLAPPLGPAGYILKEGIAPLVRVGDVEALAGQKHLHLHTLVQFNQLISSLQGTTALPALNQK